MGGNHRCIFEWKAALRLTIHCQNAGITISIKQIRKEKNLVSSMKKSTPRSTFTEHFLCVWLCSRYWTPVMNNMVKNCPGTALAVWAFTTGSRGSVLGWGTKIPQAVQCGLKKKTTQLSWKSLHSNEIRESIFPCDFLFGFTEITDSLKWHRYIHSRYNCDRSCAG